MKSLIIPALALMMLATSSSFASVSDFQSLITESIEAKKELTDKLQKSASAKSHEKIVIRENELPAENMVAPSQTLVKKTDPVGSETMHFEQQNMQRVSDELKDAQ